MQRVDLEALQKDAYKAGFQEALRNPGGWRNTLALIIAAMARQLDVEIKRLNVIGAEATRRVGECTAVLQGAPPQQFLEVASKTGWGYLVLAVLFSYGGYSTVLFSLQPYVERYGQAAVGGVSALLALSTALFFHYFLSSIHAGKPLELSIATIGCLTTLAVSLLLAVLRSQQVIADASLPPGPAPDDATAHVLETSRRFYETAGRLLVLIVPLMTAGFELATGLLFHSAYERLFSTDLSNYRQRDRQQATVIASWEGIEIRKALPEIFEKYYTAGGLAGEKADPAKVQEKKIAVLVPLAFFILLLFVLFAARAAGAVADQPSAGPASTMVILPDLTQSSDTAGPDGTTEFQKNTDAVETLLKTRTRPGQSVFVVGITSNSFQPYILVQGRLPETPGYFRERLYAGRAALVAAWRKKVPGLKPEFAQSDVLGALLAVQQLTPQMAATEIYLLSDCRQATREINLEAPSFVPSRELDRAKALGLIPSLRGASVWMMGVHSVGWSPARWNALQTFWTQLVNQSGAILRQYTTHREVLP